jgi:hypothetical protein
MELGLHKTNQAWRVDIFRDHSVEITIHFKIIEQSLSSLRIALPFP